MAIGVLLCNVGTPDAPEPGPLRRYLAEFLGDPRVLELPGWKRFIILNVFVLPFRPKKVSKAYQGIWTEQGSPLAYYTDRQAKRLEEALGEGFVVTYGMRYRRPSIRKAIEDLLNRGADRLVFFPMFPQYAGATTGTAVEAFYDALKWRREIPPSRVVPAHFDDPHYVRAACQLYRDELEKLEEPPDHIVFSFHGIPLRFVEAGDPYRRQSEKTAELMAKELGLEEGRWTCTFQSRFGREPWLEPYTDEFLRKLGKNGTQRVLIGTPGFTADCLETIEEIGEEGQEEYVEAGGKEFHRVPCLNDHPAWIEAMRAMVLRESSGWV